MLKTAVVILNYNGRSFLQKFLPGVIKESPEADVVVVDNGSLDDSVDYLETQHANVQLIKLVENRGYTGGYNEGLSRLDYELFVLLNSDVEVTPGWIPPILQMFVRDPALAACQPKILSHSDKGMYDYAGAAGGFIDALGYPFCRGRIFQSIEKNSTKYDQPIFTFWASGAALFLRNSAFKQIGGFDENYFAHMEEIDLCWRLQNAGYKIAYNGASAVNHIGGGTLSKSNPTKTYYNFRNGLSMLVKNLNGNQLWWKLPVRVILDLVAAIKFLLFDTYKDSLAVLRAHIYFWNNLNRIFGHRRIAKAGRVRPSVHLDTIYRGSIVMDYYVKRKRKFSELRFATNTITYRSASEEDNPK